MTDDLPAVIRQFADKIFFVHMRDVVGTPEKFQETFHDAGQTRHGRLHARLSRYRLQWVLRPDHVPTMAGDSNDQAGYSAIGRLFAIGYIKGIREAVYGEARPA